MSQTIGTEDNQPTDESAAASPLALWLIGGAFALMAGSGVVLWLTFGPGMFAGMLTAVVNCF
jgi:hypothetical protein